MGRLGVKERLDGALMMSKKKKKERKEIKYLTGNSQLARKGTQKVNQ